MPSLNTNSINSQADNISVNYGSASLIIYSGTPPADANTALSGNVALATHSLAGFAASINGIIVAAPIADDVIDASGVASFARLVDGIHTMQVTVGIASAELIVDDINYVVGGLSVINSLIITQPSI